MITNTGKSIISKYMLGQTPAYASYIAIGCGPQPLASSDPYGNYDDKQNLDFEMFRIPISSRGFVSEDGIDKIVFTAELPTEERYEISEVGIFSAGSNPSAGSYDSKNILLFSENENWQYHGPSSAIAIDKITSPLDSPADDNIIDVEDPVFQTNSDNTIFYKTGRSEKFERGRFLNNIIMLSGDMSDLSVDGSTLEIGTGSSHIHLTGVSFDFTQNAPTDILKLAFSVINKDGDSSDVPDSIRILVEFAATDDSSGEYARFETILNNGTDPGEYDFITNRYYVIEKELQELNITPNFTWNAVTTVKIYSTAIFSGAPSSDFYVGLDAMRLENVTTLNPLYGLVGYSVIKNTSGITVVKDPNTSNYIEFRFSIGVT